jgi:hypothetical protein
VRFRGLGVAVFGCVVQILGSLPGLTAPDLGIDSTWFYLSVPIAVITTVVLFGWVVPRGGSRAALISAAAALLSLALFRIGVTVPLAAAAMVMARDVPVREEGANRWALVAMLAAMVTLGFFAWFSLLDAFAAVEDSRGQGAD